MRILSNQEIHAVCGSAATPTATGSKTSPFTLLFLGVFWSLAGLFGFGITDFI